MMWSPPAFTLRWGSYFKPAIEDEQKLVDMVSKARDANLVTLRTAVQRIARQFAIDNVDQYLDALKEEADERADTKGEAKEEPAAEASDNEDEATE